MYWIDGKLNYIGESNLDGSSRVNLKVSVSHPFSLVVYNSAIYWTEWGSNSVKMINRDTWENSTILDGLKNPKDILVSLSSL